MAKQFFNCVVSLIQLVCELISYKCVTFDFSAKLKNKFKNTETLTAVSGA